jgi:hypothetical protein
MSTRTVELSAAESAVFGTIKTHKCISEREIEYRSGVPLREVVEAVKVLDKARLIMLSEGGSCPKRYKPRLAKVKKVLDGVQVDGPVKGTGIENDASADDLAEQDDLEGVFEAMPLGPDGQAVTAPGTA